nr:translocon-associated protein subunit beta [Tanacetum cinerariifolium]
MKSLWPASPLLGNNLPVHVGPCYRYGSLVFVISIVVLYVYLVATPSKSGAAKGSKKKRDAGGSGLELATQLASLLQQNGNKHMNVDYFVDADEVVVQFGILIKCMQTRSSSKFVGESSTNPTSTNPKRRNRRRSKQRVEPFALEEVPKVTMADQCTMAELFCAPTEDYAEAIVVPPISAEHFELKHSLINLVTSKQFFGFEKEDPHAHIRYFNKITSTLKYKDVPKTVPTDGNTFTDYHDNIQRYVSAAAMNNNYNQGCRPQGDPHFRASNQMGPHAPTHKPQVVIQSDFQAYMKANDAVMKNMQTQLNSLKNSNIELKSMFGQFMKMNTASSSSGSGSLPSNTVPNPREDLKAITTRSGATLTGPLVSPSHLPSKEVDQEPETITDQVLTGSTNNVPPPVVQPSPVSTSSAPISSPKIPESNPHQPPIPYL